MARSCSTSCRDGSGGAKHASRHVGRQVAVSWRRLHAVLAIGAALSTGGVGRAGAQTSATTGWSFSYTVSTTTAGKPVQGADMTYDVQIWRGIARIGVRSGPMQRLTGEHGVLLVRAADSVISIVNPARREILQAASADFASLLSGGPPGAVRLTVSDVSSRTRLLGKGDPLATYATQRHQIDQRYTLQVAASNVQRSIRNEQVITLDISRDVDRLDPGFRAFAEQFVRSLGQPGEVRRALLAASSSPLRGFPVRSTTLAVTISGTDTLRSETRASISAPRRETVDSSAFRIPAGYRVTDMSRLLRPRRQP